MPFNDPELLGNVFRGAVALGIMMLVSGAAARVCRDRTSWTIAAGALLLVFVWLLAGVVPHPHQAGLLYALQWGIFGAAVYAGARALRAESAAGDVAPDPETLLGFWFGDDLASGPAVAARSKTWFGSDEDFDHEIQTRFGDWPKRALAGELDAWSDSPRGALALVLVLDQLTRNLNRNSAEAFAGDARARDVALAAIEAGADQTLHPIEVAFLYLPLEHAEDPALQRRCVELFEGLCARAQDAHAEQLAQYLDYAKRHRDVIEKFGRFPHRNAALGRAYTEEEKRWLAEGGDTFGG